MMRSKEQGKEMKNKKIYALIALAVIICILGGGKALPA